MESVTVFGTNTPQSHRERARQTLFSCPNQFVSDFEPLTEFQFINRILDFLTGFLLITKVDRRPRQIFL